MALPKIYNWERVRAALKVLSDAFPDEFPNWVLIGGGASWFFREQLKNANDPDFRVRIAAANALSTLRATDQVKALERMAAKELDGRAVRTAREAAAKLRKGGETASEVKALREEFEKLREQNGELRDKVDRLEARTSGKP